MGELGGFFNVIENYGTRGVINSWFQSHLSNRTQTIEIDNHLFNKEVTLCGVPQGSVLGTLYFLLYIKDIFKSYTELSFHLFADDTTLTYAQKNCVYLNQLLIC